MFDETGFTLKVRQIQERLRSQNVDGWLLYNFRGTNIFATKILEMPADVFLSRRHFYSPNADAIHDTGMFLGLAPWPIPEKIELLV